MKPIKITYENIPALDAALAKVNGNATAHTATGNDNTVDIRVYGDVVSF